MTADQPAPDHPGDRISCRHPFGCQAPGEGCIGPCPVSAQEAEAIEREAFTDHPGDRDQQQAAEDARMSIAVQRAYQRGYEETRGRYEPALAAARAEEAARWQAKIEALIFGFDGGGLSSLQLVELLRAVLDGEQR